MVWEAIELSASAIELLGVAIILIAIVHGTGRFLFHMQQRVEDAYEQYKVQLAKALLLGLEFLVAADIVRTVALEPTLHNVGILGVLVIVRTFLSWSIVVEIEGRWPWRGARLVPGRLERQNIETRDG
jgi:uncharacterized membrane protein